MKIPYPLSRNLKTENVNEKTNLSNKIDLAK